jgi:hypothetical protein
MMPRSLIPILLIALDHQSWAQGDRNQDAAAAVQAWYKLAGNGADQAHLLRYGTVGGGPYPLTKAYQQLAPSLRQQMTEAQFFEHFRGLAHLELLQAHVVDSDADRPDLQVFVEEERTMDFAGVPAVAWYKGTLAMTQTADGWKISSLKDITPEDIISHSLGGHMPWVFEPEQVATLSIQPCCSNGAPNCKQIGKTISSNGQTAEVSISACGAAYQVRVAKVHSGEWIFLDKRPASSR